VGDFGSATETVRIIDLFALQVFAKIWTAATFDFCNTIVSGADIYAQSRTFSRGARNPHFRFDLTIYGAWNRQSKIENLRKIENLHLNPCRNQLTNGGKNETSGTEVDVNRPALVLARVTGFGIGAKDNCRERQA
jgi:hypothetical protein